MKNIEQDVPLSMNSDVRSLLKSRIGTFILHVIDDDFPDSPDIIEISSDEDELSSISDDEDNMEDFSNLSISSRTN